MDTLIKTTKDGRELRAREGRAWFDGQSDSGRPCPLKKAVDGLTHWIQVQGANIGLTRAEADAMTAELDAQGRQIYAMREARIEAAIPGLAEMRTAAEEERAYGRAFDRMMEDEGNDGVRPPTRPAKTVEEVKAMYPRAAMYLRAESYSCALHYLKAAAGSKAMRLLEDGGSEAEAAKILDNWLPESAYTD